MSDSVPFCTLSVQAGAAQRSPSAVTLHTFEMQSDGSRQLFVAAQTPQEPPQSTSVSEPFFTPSWHVAALQVPTPPTTRQTPLTQSSALVHRA
jgi:hypothetical protein